jgi:hypothetical protein
MRPLKGEPTIGKVVNGAAFLGGTILAIGTLDAGCADPLNYLFNFAASGPHFLPHSPGSLHGFKLHPQA